MTGKLEFWQRIPSLLGEHIKEYDSDTFNAKARLTTQEEADKIAVFFINRFLRGGNIEKNFDTGLLADKLGIDGLQIDEVLNWLRDGELKENETSIVE